MNKKQHGFLLINKPKDVSSFKCGGQIKKLLGVTNKNRIKIGHAGTLDPFATGLLLICIGREATKSIAHMINLDKTYLVKAKLGELTATLDHTGIVLKQEQSGHITKKMLLEAIEKLGDKYEQTPPIYSALKHEGRPLYKLAREKKLSLEELEKIIENKKRLVTLHELRLTDFDPPYFSFKARVSKGTYIRSLANDIAEKTGTCATTYELERTHIGKLSLEQAVDLEKLQTIDDLNKYLLDEISP